MSAVQFDVAYQLREYREFVIEHVCHLRGRSIGFFGRAFLSVFVAPVFLLKASRVGRCSFVLDSASIVRTSKHGKLTIPWDKVVTIHRYSPGLLIEKRGGAVPIPYRCLTPSQRASVEAMVKEWERARTW
jgi:class 3 adenylate cyclase